MEDTSREIKHPCAPVIKSRLSLSIAATVVSANAAWRFRTREGHNIQFIQQNGRWHAEVSETHGLFTKSAVYPVLSKQMTIIEDALSFLSQTSAQHSQRRIHFMRSGKQRFVFVGELGLRGGGIWDQGDASPLERTVSSALFILLKKETIVTTESLVEELNTSMNAFEKEALREWVQHYINWFSRQSIESLTQKLIHEYTCFKEIEADSPINRKLLNDWLCSLCNRIHSGLFGEHKIIEALDEILQSLDRRVFQDDPSLLIQLANTLLEKVDPSRVALTRETYPTHSIVLCVLHRTLHIIQQVAPRQLDPSQENGVYASFRDQLQNIAACNSYYPFVYHSSLIEISLDKLKTLNRDAVIRMNCKRLMTGFRGAVYIFSGIRALTELSFDLDSFERGYENLQEAFCRQGIEKKPWHDWLQALQHSASFAIGNSGLLKAFTECYRSLKDKEERLRDEDSRRALRFGIIHQLLLLALYGSSQTIQDHGQRELIALTRSSEADSGEWMKDRPIVEALLDALGCICAHQYGNEDARSALERMLAMQDKNVQHAVSEWLGSASVEEKLESMIEAPSATETGALFRTIRKEILDFYADLGHQTKQELIDMQTQLRDFYRRPQFTTVDSLFEGDAPKDLHSIHSQLMLLEKKEAISESSATNLASDSSISDEDHVSDHYERVGWVKSPILKESLFDKRKQLPDYRLMDVSRVLLIGDPGTGKTTLARQLAFLWAEKLWGHQFSFVFFLQIRELQASKYDDSSERREETLATAIATCCFPRCNKKSFLALRDQIEEVLEDSRTLIILDGLDEKRDSSSAIIEEAKNGRAKLLMLSRPFGVREERLKADIEVEHVGFNDQQLEDFITEELSVDGTQTLQNFLGTNPIVWSIAHVPVNAQILCALWKDPYFKNSRKSTIGSLSMLYQRMTQFTWERYVQKFDCEAVDAVDIFNSLGQIAFDALKQGQILIDEWLVQDHARTLQVKRLLKESGFLLLQSVGFYYQFPHLTFQEYFAGRWLARQFCAGTQEDKDLAKSFLAQYKYSAEFRTMLSFMMGEVSMMRGAEGAAQLFECINEAPRELLDIQHVLLELRLVNEHLSIVTKKKALSSFDAVDRMKALLQKSAADRPLLELLTEALKSLSSVIQSFPDLIDPMLDLFGNPWHSLFAMKATVQYIRFTPDSVPHVLDTVMELKSRSDKKLQNSILRFLKETALVVPSQTKMLLPVFLAEQDNEDTKVRAIIVDRITYMIPGAQEHVIPALNCVMKLCSDDMYAVRCAAVNAVRRIIYRRGTEETAALMQAVLPACWDTHSVVRDQAVDTIRTIIEQAPQLIPQVKEGLKVATQDDNAEVREHAMNTVSALIPKIPEEANDFVDCVSAGCEDDCPNVRGAGLKAASHIIRISAEHRDDLLAKLIAGFKDEYFTVRKVAIQDAGHLLHRLTEDEVSSIANELPGSFTNQDFLVRIAAVEAAGALIRVSPERLPSLLDSIVAGCHDEVSTVRQKSVEVLAQVLNGSSRLTPRLMQHITMACYDSFSHVRKAAFVCIVDAIRSLPDYLPALIESLTEFCESESAAVRKGVVETIGQLLKIGLDHGPELYEMLAFAFEDPSHQVRASLLEVLEDVISDQLHLVHDLHEKLFRLCIDNMQVVRKAGLERMKQLLCAIPDGSSTLVTPIKEACTDPHALVRNVAFEIMREIIILLPEQIADLTAYVEKGCTDGQYHVRQEAILTVAEIIKVDVEHDINYTHFLTLGSKDKHGRVRRTAIKAMGVILEVAPEHFMPFIEYVQRACNDRNFIVRRASFEVIEKIIDSQTDLISHFIPHLIDAFLKKLPHERLNAAELLQLVPIKALMDFFWNNVSLKADHYLPLVLRFYEVPLTIADSNTSPHCKQCTVHLPGGTALEWEKSCEEVDRLVHLISASFQQKLEDNDGENV